MSVLFLFKATSIAPLALAFDDIRPDKLARLVRIKGRKGGGSEGKTQQLQLFLLREAFFLFSPPLNICVLRQSSTVQSEGPVL